MVQADSAAVAKANMLMESCMSSRRRRERLVEDAAVVNNHPPGTSRLVVAPAVERSFVAWRTLGATTPRCPYPCVRIRAVVSAAVALSQTCASS